MNNIKEAKQPSVVLNYVYNVIYEAFILIIPFVTAAYTSRIFGADGVGIYSFSNIVYLPCNHNNNITEPTLNQALG